MSLKKIKLILNDLDYKKIDGPPTSPQVEFYTSHSGRRTRLVLGIVGPRVVACVGPTSHGLPKSSTKLHVHAI